MLSESKQTSVLSQLLMHSCQVIIRHHGLMRCLYQCQPIKLELTISYPATASNFIYVQMTNVDLDSQINSVDVEGDYMPTNELFWSKQKFESRFESISEYEVKDVEGVQGVQGDQDKSAGIYSIQRIGNTFYLGNRANNVVVCQKTAESFTTRTLSGHSDSVLCLQVDDESIISASSDNTVKVWSRSSYECLDTLSGHTSSVLQLQFNSTRLVTCSKDKTVIVWKIVDGKFVEETTLQDHKAAVNVVVFDAHRICSAGGDRVIRVYDATSFASKGVLKGHTRGIACLSMLPGGDTIVSGSFDNNLRIWSLSQMKCRHVLTGELSCSTSGVTWFLSSARSCCINCSIVPHFLTRIRVSFDRNTPRCGFRRSQRPSQVRGLQLRGHRVRIIRHDDSSLEHRNW